MTTGYFPPMKRDTSAADDFLRSLAPQGSANKNYTGFQLDMGKVKKPEMIEEYALKFQKRAKEKGQNVTLDQAREAVKFGRVQTTPRGKPVFGGGGTFMMETLKSKAQRYDQGYQAGLLKLEQDKLAWEQEKTRSAALGYYIADPFDWKTLGGSDPMGYLNEDGTVKTDEGSQRAFMQNKVALKGLYKDLFNREASDRVLDQLARGEKVEGLAISTLSGQELDLAAGQLDLQEQALKWQKVVDRLRESGDTYDEESGLTLTSLQSRIVQINEAQVSGELYNGEPTLQAKAQLWNQTFQEDVVFGTDRKQVKYDDRGNAVEVWTHIYGTNEVALALQTGDQDFKKKMEEGWWYFDEETGEERRVKGTTEQIDDNWRRSEMARVGYDEVVTDNSGNPVEIDGVIQKIRIEGTQSAQTALANRELALREAGMAADIAHRTATMEQDERRYTGYFKTRGVTMDDLGFTPENIELWMADYVPWDEFKVDGKLDPDLASEWFNSPANDRALNNLATSIAGDTDSQMARRMRSVLGRDITYEEVKTLLGGGMVAQKGKDGNDVVEWVHGTVGLEQERNDLQLTLQQRNIAADVAERTATEDYNDKVAGGFWTIGQTGHWNWVRGTQEQAEHNYLLDEQRRVGYDRLVKNDNGTVSQIHIMGTQEIAERTEFGYFQVQEDGSERWIPGTKEHETALRQMEIDYNISKEQAQYIRSMSTTDHTYLGQEYRAQRAWYYTSTMGLTAEEAQAKAQEDWDAADESFGPPLQQLYEEIRIRADRDKFDAQQEIARTNALINGLAGFGGNVATLFIQNGGLELLRSKSKITAKKIVDTVGPSNITQDQALSVVNSVPSGWGFGGVTAETGVSAKIGVGTLSPSALDAGLGTSAGSGAAASVSEASSLSTIGLNPGTLIAASGYAAFLYGGFKFYKAWDHWKKHGNDYEKEDKALFDNWFDGLSQPDQHSVQQIFTDAEIDMDDRDKVYEAVRSISQLITSDTTSDGVRQKINEFYWGKGNVGAIKYRDTVEKILLFDGTLDIGQISENIRLIKARDILSFSADDLGVGEIDGLGYRSGDGIVKRSETDLVIDTWRLLPGVSRSEDEKDRGEPSIDVMLDDIRKFSADLNIMNADALVEEVRFFDQSYTNITSSEAVRVNGLYDQLAIYLGEKYDPDLSWEQKLNAISDIRKQWDGTPRMDNPNSFYYTDYNPRTEG